MLEIIIETYLEANSLSGENGVNYTYIFDENKQEYFIDMWLFDIEKPIIDQQALKDAHFLLLKSTKVKELEKNTSNRVHLDYPFLKEIAIENGINGYDAEDLTTMKSFIAEKIYECKAIEVLINACNTEEELQTININIT